MSRIEQAVPYIKTKKTNYRFVVLALIFIVYAINYADRTNIGAVLPFIIDEFHINNFEAGAIASMFFLGYALSQIPAGFFGNDSNLLIVFYVQIMPDDFVMQLHR
ncbi:MFS transporter, partial [Enterobacter hormaechei]|uniref:MFS transporter n=1 Tax=Enterobacter hormaechei TaxID=158836 RepID=UPI00217D3F21